MIRRPPELLPALALSGGCLAAGAVAFILAVRSYTLIDTPPWTMVLIPAGLLWAGLTRLVYRWLPGRSTLPILLVCSALILYGCLGTAWAAVCLANCAGDIGPQSERAAAVLRTWERGAGGVWSGGRKRGSVYFVEIDRRWSESGPISLQVPIEVYRSAVDGERTLRLRTRPGRLGLEWTDRPLS